MITVIALTGAVIASIAWCGDKFDTMAVTVLLALVNNNVAMTN